MAKVFDPRDGNYKKTDNPALILLDLIQGRFRADQLSNDIIPRIKVLADYCDELTTLKEGDTYEPR